MSRYLDPFVSDSSYATPLPQQPCEAALWRAVTSLYEYSALPAPLNVGGPSTAALSEYAVPTSGKRISAVEVLQDSAPAERDDFAVPCGGFYATMSPVMADKAASPLSSSSRFTAPKSSPLAPSVAVPLANLPALAQQRSPDAPAVAPLLPRTRPTSTCSVHDDSLARDSTASYTHATCYRLLEPVRALLTQFNADNLFVGASVVDLAVQHPLPCLRLELVRLLLTFKRWNWSMCAPVAVAAGVGDIDVLEHLLSVEELEPNMGFPLTVAVRCSQHERVLPLLLSHPRIKPNYGDAFYVAVATGNTGAMHILGAAAGVDVNGFAHSEGTSALLHALRQLLICSVAEGAARQPSTTDASVPLPSRKPRHAITPPSSPLPSTAEERAATISLLLAGRTSSAAKANATHESLSLLSGKADRSDAAPCTVATISGGTSSAAVSSIAAALPGQRDRALASGESAVRVVGDGHEAVTASVHEEKQSAAHTAGFRQDTRAHLPCTAQHWQAVFLYLLNHPAIEVNAGFYTTPLQMAVSSGNVEVVAWLLQHPHLRPNRLPRAAAVLRDSYYLLRRQVLSKDALKCVVATPVEMAVQLHQREAFKLLVRDQRVRVPGQLTMHLERQAWNAEAIPYLTILAQHRAHWEGWGWRRRRQCVLIATAANVVVALCTWAVWCAWYDSLRACGVVLLGTHAAQVVMSVALFVWETCMTGAPSGAGRPPAAKPVPVLAALVQHRVPTWPGTWRCGAAAVLLLCPGMVPLLDLVCAWNLFEVHRSRQPLPTAVRTGGAAPAMSPQHRPAGPPDSSARGRGSSNDSRERIDRARGHSRWFSSTRHEKADLSAASSASSHDSLTDAPCAASVDRGESDSHPPAATARALRPAMVGGGVQRRFHTLCSAAAAAPVEGAVAGPAHTATTSAAGQAAASSSELLCRRSPSLTTNGISARPSIHRRDSWVMPGRPSRFAASTEYHAPDLTLRALAYVTYDRLLVAPRLLLSCVGIFMFMFMAFPSSPPAAFSPAAALVGNGSTVWMEGAPPQPLFAIATRSIFTIYYYDHSFFKAPTGAAALESKASLATLPRFTIAMGLVGLCGLVASTVSGAALLVMATSLRTITAQSCFTSSGDMDNSDGSRGGDDHALRHVEWSGSRGAGHTRGY
ncbi:hypothetical protein LSCM1_05281 [Leishmania martiniquensis]|uniref:Ankyrin repeat protein n=1 Tax=Leishmania martiniquensis TaxID=1580590 RepID=A0A836KST8_9TRYP|nr:hypothetical protein LSCM1_05281 [Leishmania martiniquensis]